MRALAQKSAEAAADTTDKIERNAVLTDTGQKINSEVSGSLEKIMEKACKLNELISEISASSEEQARGVEQITIAMSQMEKVTQENAAAAEENAATGNAMKDETANLEDAVAIAMNIIKD